jgi:hypothetical protein
MVQGIESVSLHLFQSAVVVAVAVCLVSRCTRLRSMLSLPPRLARLAIRLRHQKKQ